MQSRSKTQQRVLECIINWFNDHKLPPTLRELTKELGYNSTCSTRYYLTKLKEEGYIRLRKGIARGIELIKPITGIPILGRVSAGKPIDAIENIEEYIDPSSMFKNTKDLFALKIKGDSMIQDGIFEGDIVFVHKQQKVNNGEIVVALIEDEAVVKKFYLTQEGVKLVSANPKYKPIISKNVQILGKVITVLRKY